MRAPLTVVAAATALPALVAAGPIPTLDPDVVPEPVQEAAGCDPIDPSLCLFPFPNDAFTVEDPTTDTGRRVDFSWTAMPRNGTDATAGELGGEGKPVDPTEWNRNDGFSPGSPVLTYVPGLDLHRTWGTTDRPHSDVGPNEIGYFDHRDHIADIALYEREDAPIVILEVVDEGATGNGGRGPVVRDEHASDRGEERGGADGLREGSEPVVERHPFWSELDTHPETTDDRRALILRPAVNFTEGARYIVALRNLKDADGDTIEQTGSFSAYRDGSGADAARQEHYNTRIFPYLEEAGIARGELYLAWDFTVASERNLTERMLTIRDHAFGEILGDNNLADRQVDGEAPAFTVESTEERIDTWTDSFGQRHGQPYRRIRGRVTVPNYLDRPQQVEGRLDGSVEEVEEHAGGPLGDSPTADGDHLPYDPPIPGSRFYDDPADLDTLPDQNPTEAFVHVPYVCDVPTEMGPTFSTLYGHGLLGTRDQIGDVKWPRRYGFAGCGLDWWGMSTPDVPTVATIIADLSNFPSLADRAQQGFLNFLFAGRALVHPNGFASHPAFQAGDGSPLLVVDEPRDGIPTQQYYDGNSQGGIMGGSLVAVSPDIHRGILGVPAMNYSTLLNRSVDWEGAYAVPFYLAYQDPLERQLTFALIQMLWDRGEANGYAAHMTDDPLPNTPAHEVMLQVAFSDHQVTVHAAEVEARTIGAPIGANSRPAAHWEFQPFTEHAAFPFEGSSLIYWDSGNATPPNGNIPADQNGDPHGDPRNEPAAGWQEAHFLLTGWNVDVCGGGPYLTNDHPDLNGTAVCHEPSYWPGTTPEG